jgi:hypothetical protein
MKKSFDISKFLTEHTITAGIVDNNIMWLGEGEDDKYTHIGYGHYKLKGKEKDANATVFSKDDSGKYIATTDDEKSKGGDSKEEPAKPKVNIFDKPKQDTEQGDEENPNQTSIEFGKERPDLPKKAGSDIKTSYDDFGRDYDAFTDYVMDKISLKQRKDIRKSWEKDGAKTQWQDYLIQKANDIAAGNGDDSSSSEMDSTKLTSIMPQADKKAFSGKSDIDSIPPEKKREVSMKIDQLAKIASEARAKGEKAPNYNLCKVTVPGTNLYCDQNLGVPRAEMPQFKGTPQPGSPASKMKTDSSGEVDTEPLFKEMLKKKGIKTQLTEIPSDALKATQSELVGAKVAGMTKALEQDNNHPGITAPIYVSRDGYVIDGHHRWAAITSMAIKNGHPANMKVVVIDDDAQNIVPMANKFAQDIGVAAKKAETKKESVQSSTSLVELMKKMKR